MSSIRKRGTRWQAQIRRAGRATLSRTFTTKKDAEAWARQTEVELDRSGWSTALDRKLLDEMTLGELVVRYRNEVSSRKRGAAVEIVVLDAFLRHRLCRLPLAQVNARSFAVYRDERLQSVKAATLRRQLASLHHMFEVARDEWGIPLKTNPIAKLRLDGGDTRRERRLREGEWERLASAAKSRKNPFVWPVMRFALETAMRRGEILNMRWDHVSDDRCALLIPETKSGYARTIPLSPGAIEVLEQGHSKTAVVFPISANAFRLAWQRIKQRADVEDLRFHDLRHEAISRFFEMGLSVPEVALISGHRDPRMLFRYTHPMREQISRKLSDASS